MLLQPQPSSRAHFKATESSSIHGGLPVRRSSSGSSPTHRRGRCPSQPKRLLSHPYYPASLPLNISSAAQRSSRRRVYQRSTPSTSSEASSISNPYSVSNPNTHTAFDTSRMQFTQPIFTDFSDNMNQHPPSVSLGMPASSNHNSLHPLGTEAFTSDDTMDSGMQGIQPFEMSSAQFPGDFWRMLNTTGTRPPINAPQQMPSTIVPEASNMLAASASSSLGHSQATSAAVSLMGPADVQAFDTMQNRWHLVMQAESHLRPQQEPLLMMQQRPCFARHASQGQMNNLVLNEQQLSQVRAIHKQGVGLGAGPVDPNTTRSPASHSNAMVPSDIPSSTALQPCGNSQDPHLTRMARQHHPTYGAHARRLDCEPWDFALAQSNV